MDRIDRIKARMKDEGGRMKEMLLFLDSFYFILHVAAFILAFLSIAVNCFPVTIDN
jgi:hypothetical protein